MDNDPHPASSSPERMATCEVSLKLLIDKRNRTVLFAEAGKDFVDFLLHILVLPAGQVIRLLTKSGKLGSLSNLYGSVEELDDVYIESSKKDFCLKPKAPAFLSKIPFILPETSSLDSPHKTYYRCSSRPHINCCNYVAEDPCAYCPQCTNRMSDQFTLVGSAPETYHGCPFRSHTNCRNYVALDRSEKCPECTRYMTHNLTPVKAPAGNPDHKNGFVLGRVMYMVTDDLTVKPATSVSTITLLKKSNVEDIGLIEEKVVSLGMDEGLKLLRTSLHSERVLTDVFLGVKRERS